MWEQAVDPSDALARLGRALLDEGYRFITPTPETHRRVLARGGAARTLRDVFGWSQPIAAERLPAQVRAIAEQAGVLLDSGGLVRSKVRFSSIGDMLFAHSSYPTVSADSVFFGPDTYRFAALCLSRLESPGHLADVGCGSGAGGLLLAGRARSVQLVDINPAALRFAASNAALNRVTARCAESDVLSGTIGRLDTVIANPPYLADDLGRTYRDGGGQLGCALSVRIARESLERLAPGGRLLLYTATPVIDGSHALYPDLEPLLRHTRFDYRELDPDVFGEELERPAYARAERIAVVALDAVKL